MVDKRDNRVYSYFVMNINVLVLNVPRDVWSSDRRGSSRPETRSVVEEVIELLPENGAWVGRQELVSARTDGYTGATQTAGSLFPAPRFVTYDHKGRVLRAPSEKGRHVNITA